MDEHCKGCIRYLKSCSGLSKELCEKHKLRIPRTNAYRIRSMTDEELADFLNSVMIDATRHGSLGSPLHVCGGEGVRTLDWLKEEGE